MALRSEFVRAFVEHVGPRPASELMKVRLPALLTISALTAVVALVVGVFWHLIADEETGGHAGPSQMSGPSQTPSKVKYAAVAGWGCKGKADRGFEAHGRTAEWSTVASGGWRDDGCQGTYETLPMSGKQNTDDRGQYAEFRYAFCRCVKQCDVDVFVPEATGEDALAGAAHYEVLGGAGSEPYAEFVVDQSVRRGEWISGGAFPAKDGKLVIRITNRGVPEEPGARLAVTQVKVACSR